MADFDFWHRAEIKFRRLQPPPPKPGEVHHASHNGLCAWWMPNGWDDGKSYHFFNDGDDGEANRNIERLFKIAAESAEVELGHQGGDSAVVAWLDRLRLEGLYVTNAATGSRIINRVCDASAEYCLKCETGAKAAAREARSHDGGGGLDGIAEKAIDPFEQDFDDRPLGDNPFPPDTSAYKAFEEATWEAKERIGLLRSKLLTGHETVVEFVDATCRYWLAHFSAVA